MTHISFTLTVGQDPLQREGGRRRRGQGARAIVALSRGIAHLPPRQGTAAQRLMT